MTTTTDPFLGQTIPVPGFEEHPASTTAEPEPQLRMLLIPVTGPFRFVDVVDYTGMASHIGAGYIERVGVADGWAMAVDDEGLLRGKLLNTIGFRLYAGRSPIVGDVLLGAEAWDADGIDWADTTEDAARDFLNQVGAA